MLKEIKSIDKPTEEDLKEICHLLGGNYHETLEDYCVLDEETSITALEREFSIRRRGTTITVKPDKINIKKNVRTGERYALFMTKDNDLVEINRGERFASVSAYLS